MQYDSMGDVCITAFNTSAQYYVVYSQILMNVQKALVCAIKRQLVQILMEVISVHATVDTLEID